jgi:Spy/CpxP family protein refolding chaperone
VRRRPGVVAAVMLLLAFVVGGMAGMALEEALGLDWFDFLDEDARAADGRLLSDLELSETQRERVEEILDAQERRLEAYWESRLPDMRGVIAESYEQIRAVLNSEQRDRFDARVRELGLPQPREPD